MKILILLFSIFAIWHFLYEGIIAPSIRLHLRNRLFALRDELRKEKIEGSISPEDERAFWFVEHGINNFINRLPNLTIERFKKLTIEHELNPELHRTLEEHLHAISIAKNQRIHEIFNRTNSVIGSAFLTNMGGWFIYIIPAALVISLMSKLSKLATEIIVAPTKELERMIPQTCA